MPNWINVTLLVGAILCFCLAAIAGKAMREVDWVPGIGLGAFWLLLLHAFGTLAWWEIALSPHLCCHIVHITLAWVIPLPLSAYFTFRLYRKPFWSATGKIVLLLFVGFALPCHYVWKWIDLRPAPGQIDMPGIYYSPAFLAGLVGLVISIRQSRVGCAIVAVIIALLILAGAVENLW